LINAAKPPESERNRMRFPEDEFSFDSVNNALQFIAVRLKYVRNNRYDILKRAIELGTIQYGSGPIGYFDDELAGYRYYIFDAN
jgi:hypothetical protein